MRPALIGPAYFIYVIQRLDRKQLPGYYLNKEHAENVAKTFKSAHVNSVTAISYDAGRTFHRITIAGESEQKITMIDEIEDGDEPDPSTVRARHE